MKRKYFGSLILSRLDTETRLGKILDKHFVQIFLQLSLFLSETEKFFLLEHVAQLPYDFQISYKQILILA